MAQGQKTQKDLRIPLFGSYNNRTSTSGKDQRFLNMIPESKKTDQLNTTRVNCIKRSGNIQLCSVTGAGTARGIERFYSYYIVAIGTKLFRVNSSTLAVTDFGITLTSSTDQLYMVYGNSSTLGDYLFVGDGTNAWIISSIFAITQITDADFPSPYTGACFLDGYIFVSSGSDIFNSDVDDPYAWDPTNFIPAEVKPDTIRGLTVHNNHVVAFGTFSIEFFYDAANASASPLSRNDSAIIPLGTLAPDTVFQNERSCVFVGSSTSVNPGLFMYEGFQLKKISDEYLDRILERVTDLTTLNGYGIRVKGHNLYVLNCPSINRTIVMDLDEKTFHEWSYNVASAHTMFPCKKVVVGFGPQYYAPVWVHDTDGYLYYFDDTTTTDNAVPILVEVRTNNFDADTFNWKFCYGLKVIGDVINSGLGLDIELYYSDDDYNTWVGPFVQDISMYYPPRVQMGRFRRRSFKILHSAASNLRLEAIEINFSEGVS